MDLNPSCPQVNSTLQVSSLGLRNAFAAAFGVHNVACTDPGIGAGQGLELTTGWGAMVMVTPHDYIFITT